MVEPMTDEERVKIINSPEYRRSEALLFHIHTRYAAVKTVGDSIELTRFLMDEFTAAEAAAREDERARIVEDKWENFCRETVLAEVARALGVEDATRELRSAETWICEHCGWKHIQCGYLRKCDGCSKPAPRIPLTTLDEIVAAGLAPWRECVESLKALLAIHNAECKMGDKCGAVVEARERLRVLPLREPK